MDAGQTNVVGTDGVVERLRRMLAEHRSDEGEDAFGGKAKNKKQKTKIRRDRGIEGSEDRGGEESPAIDNRQSTIGNLLHPADRPSPIPNPQSSIRNSQSSSGVPTGLMALDAGLPWGGLPLGAVSQILDGGPGVGVMSLALAVAGRAARGDNVAGPGWVGCGGVEAKSARPIVVIDPAGDFYPPAVAKFGLDPERLLVVRPMRAVDAVWAADQCLRCPAVAAVVARLERLGRVHSRRLQLAAEAGGGIGLVVTPLAGRERTFVAVAIALEGEEAGGGNAKNKKQKAKMSDGGGLASAPVSDRPESRSHKECRRVRVMVLKVREGIPMEPFVVGLDDETGFMPVHAVVESGAAGAGRKRAGA